MIFVRVKYVLIVTSPVPEQFNGHWLCFSSFLISSPSLRLQESIPSHLRLLILIHAKITTISFLSNCQTTRLLIFSYFHLCQFFNEFTYMAPLRTSKWRFPLSLFGEFTNANSHFSLDHTMTASPYMLKLLLAMFIGSRLCLHFSIT